MLYIWDLGHFTTSLSVAPFFSAMRCLVVFSLFFALNQCVPGAFTNVFVGFDEHTSTDQQANLLVILDKIPFTIPHPLNMSNFEAIEDALADPSSVLFLCSSFVPMNRSEQMSQLISTFVDFGGTIIYTAGSGDTRSADTAVWLNESLLLVHSARTDFSYAGYEYYLGVDKLRGYPTSESFLTSFGRTYRGSWGTPFSRYADPVYWFSGGTHHMGIDINNENYCMIRRSGALPYLSEDSCWVFSFPFGEGHVVELAADFANSDLDLEDESTKPFMLMLASAVGIHLTEILFPPKSQNIVLLDGYLGSAQQAIFYDLAQNSNVYLWDGFDIQTLYSILDMTQSEAIVVADFLNRKKGLPVYPHSNQLANLVVNGKNMVTKSHTLYFTYQLTDIL